MIGTSERVLLQDVGPRDGLQNEERSLNPQVRANLVDRLVEAGLTRIQIGSFVNPKWVPQMAGTDEVWKHIKKRDGVRYSVLVLNERGLDQALAARIPHVEIFASVSETHSLKNTNMSVEKAVGLVRGLTERAKENGVTVTAGVMCAFGCFYEGAVPLEKVLGVLESFREAGPHEFGLADTTGMGKPDQVRRMLVAVERMIGLETLSLHLHDTHAHGLANLRAALEAGVRRFDSSVGGLGGCPFVPGAKGNISTEATVGTIEGMGLSTSVDVEMVVSVRRELQQLLGRELSPS
ncbi:hydroxymethylglutaryl-CoA lyase [Thermodesulfobacteriota bacterium]